MDGIRGAGPESRRARDAGAAEPTKAHEHSDVNVRAILLFIAGLIVVAAVIHVGVWLLFDLFESRTASADPRPAPLSERTLWERVSPPVQTRPVDALKSLRVEEETRLTAEGPVDGQPGVYRIPIERAKELIVERGLPTRQNEAPAR